VGDAGRGGGGADSARVFVKGKSIQEIVRDLGVSRNTVRKVLRSGEAAFAYERSVQPLPKLGPWTADLDRLLETNDRKARRERLTMIRVFEELRAAYIAESDGMDLQKWRHRSALRRLPEKIARIMSPLL
jgi:transcriptional regulator with XRE-family HTH domain